MAAGLEISLFGTCAVRVTGTGSGPDDARKEIRGAKHRALFALLATAPLGRRSRAYLQETLWGAGDFETGHQNLRRALSDLRRSMGRAFHEILVVTATDIELVLDRATFPGGPRDGAFLEDLQIRLPAFIAWRDAVRADPASAVALTALSGQRRATRLLPTVCALPLSVPDGDRALRVVADWVAEEACRMLARAPLLSVISHLSGRAMATRLVDVAQVRATLDADYLLIGSLRRAGGELVADFDLIDTSTATILWNRNLTCPAARFAAEMPDRLANVVRAVGRSAAELALGEARQTPLPRIEDHRLLIAGVAAMHRRTLRDFLASRRYLEEAAARAPEAAQVQSWLGKWYTLSIFKGYTTDRTGDTARALDCAARALDLAPESSFALTIDGFIHGNILSRLDIADSRYLAAQEINPSESLAWLLRGSLMAFRDDGKAAIRATDTARRLSPIDPFGYYYDSLASSAHLAAGEYGRALELADRSLATNDRHISTLRTRIAALHGLDRGAEARRAAADLRRRFPDFTLSEYRRTHPSAVNRTGKLVIDALSAAGIP